MTAPILEGLDLRVLYAGRPVLEVPRIQVRAGEILAIIGPNGAGKSTLLRVLGLLEPPTSGVVRFRGSRVAWGSGDLLATRRLFASVFQEPLLCDTTVEANIALGLRLRRAASEAVTTQVQTWLARLGIAHLARREAGSLSGGEAQRCSLARAFAIQPDVLLLDEPFAALDPPTKDELLTLLHGLLRQEGCTTVFVTHDRDEALRLGDRIAVMMDGRIHQAGAPPEVFGRPISEEVARFVGVETILPGRVVAEQAGLLTVEVDGMKIEALGRATVGERVLVCLRPEDLVIRRRDERVGLESARNHLEGLVEDATSLGAQYRVRIACGPALGGVVALVTKQSFDDLALERGTPVIVTFKASAVHLIPR
ncbi:MAG: ABC transporter ATP-binding protein [candidate division NC10 bacterium]|nr:ABC transporter ATP-binding protein [candidate division NC10 bacterium]